MSVVDVIAAYNNRKPTLGEFLRAELNKRGWKPNDLARAMGKPPAGWIHKMLRDQTRPWERTLYLVAKALEVDPMTLYELRKEGKVTSAPAEDTIVSVKQAPREQSDLTAQFVLESDGDRMRVSFSGHVGVAGAMRILDALRQEGILPE